MGDLRRILHVEDEADIRDIVKLALEDLGGFEVETCASGVEALEKAEAFAPDLLLLDVMMPNMDGPSTLAALRRLPSLSDVPAVFMTAKVQEMEIKHFKSLGALDVVSKPFDPMELANTLREIWEARDAIG